MFARGTHTRHVRGWSAVLFRNPELRTPLPCCESRPFRETSARGVALWTANIGYVNKSSPQYNSFKDTGFERWRLDRIR